MSAKESRKIIDAGPINRQLHHGLSAAADSLPDQPVLIITQSADSAPLRLAGRLGFSTNGTFDWLGAQQTLAVATLAQYRPEL